VNNDHHIVATVERMVLAALPRRISDSALARAIGGTPDDLKRAFRAVRRAPLYTALLELRLDEANRLLKEDPALPPDVVALHCGFGHFGIFRRGYRRRFGAEPGLADTGVEPRAERAAGEAALDPGPSRLGEA
jgi:transcriptional regulator GlxA family with amidase domain